MKRYTIRTLSIQKALHKTESIEGGYIVPISHVMLPHPHLPIGLCTTPLCPLTRCPLTPPALTPDHDAFCSDGAEVYLLS